MNVKTHLRHSIEKSEQEIKYDANVKDVLSDKQILARIMKYSVKEFADYELDDIILCIESAPEVGVKSIYPGKSEKISGMNVESTISREGEVTFDIYFYAMTMGKKRIKVMINIEAQKDYYPGYHHVPRGIFYCARMLSEQMDTEFTAADYDDIKKVYSIWICMEAPEKYVNTITMYSMEQKDVYGKYTGEEIFDLLSVVMVRLSGKEYETKDNKLLEMLNVLLSHKIRSTEKIEILQREYDLVMNKELTGGIENMCNLSLMIREEALEEGKLYTLFELVSAGKLANTTAASYMDMDLAAFDEKMKEYRLSQIVICYPQVGH